MLTRCFTTDNFIHWNLIPLINLIIDLPVFNFAIAKESSFSVLINLPSSLEKLKNRASPEKRH